MKTNTIFISLLALILLCCSIDTPKEITNELTKKSITVNQNTFEYKIVYPDNYSPNKKYPVLLGLSGGNASEDKVDYCYYVQFRSKQLNQRIKILPIGLNGEAFMGKSKLYCSDFIDAILKEEPVQKTNWILAGTSLGGIAVFEFANERPELFEGIISMPGQLDVVNERWLNYNIILAYGSRDDSWKEKVMDAENKLKGNVKNLSVIEMKDQGHILNPDYNIDVIYKEYFTK